MLNGSGWLGTCSRVKGHDANTTRLARYSG
jgi:hypothetical protein